MGTIASLHDAAHLQAQQLLPWYVNGTLTESERGAVEAHLATCEECRSDLETERLLGVRMASVAPDVERGWADMQARIQAAKEPARQPRWFARRVPLSWAVGAQAAAVLLIVAVTLPGRQPAEYHALGTPRAVAAKGNMLVMFDRKSSEQDLRAALQRAGARIVDGPTETGAYVLHVADADRARALQTLQGDTRVTLAQPIDPQ